MSKRLIFNLISFMVALLAVVMILLRSEKMTIGIDKNDMDLTVRQGDNF